MILCPPQYICQLSYFITTTRYAQSLVSSGRSAEGRIDQGESTQSAAVRSSWWSMQTSFQSKSLIPCPIFLDAPTPDTAAPSGSYSLRSIYSMINQYNSSIASQKNVSSPIFPFEGIKPENSCLRQCLLSEVHRK